jgi:hypothetical protein
VAEVVWYEALAAVKRVVSTEVVTVTVIGPRFCVDLYGVIYGPTASPAENATITKRIVKMSRGRR